MPTIRQQIFAFLTINPNSSTADVAQHINKPELYTVKAMHGMKSAGMLLSDKQAGSKMHLWRASNRAVKFNTGETVRKATTRKTTNLATIRMELADLKEMVKRLEQTLA